jgi:TonB family protein
MSSPSALQGRIIAMLNPRLNRRPRTLKAVAYSAVGLLLIAIPLAALRAAPSQNLATVSGRVIDPTGAVVPNVSVTMTNSETHTKDVSQSDEIGNYVFRSIPAGQYVLFAKLPGFSDFKTDISVIGTADVESKITMSVDSVSEIVRVTGQRPGTVATPGPPRRIRVGGFVQNARLSSQVHPQYPPTLLNAGIEGAVTMEGIIGIDGNVLSLKVLSAEARPEFVDAAVDAVRQWHYQPTLLNGTPVEVLTTITVEFRLR